MRPFSLFCRNAAAAAAAAVKRKQFQQSRSFSANLVHVNLILMNRLTLGREIESKSLKLNNICTHTGTVYKI